MSPWSKDGMSYRSDPTPPTAARDKVLSDEELDALERGIRHPYPYDSECACCIAANEIICQLRAALTMLNKP